MGLEINTAQSTGRAVRRWTRYRLTAGVVVLGLAYLFAWRLLRPLSRWDARAEPAAMSTAADYLERHLDSNGRFAYSIRLDGKPPLSGYNVVRHAGTLYALAAYSDLTKRAELNGPILRGARFLLQRHVRTLRKKSNLRAVFSFAGEEVEGTNALVKLGACGLGLVALTKAFELDPHAVTLEELRSLGNFILFMQQPDGRFHSIYDDSTGGFGSFESLFYPGEAILGLARLHRVDPDPRWLEAVWKGLEFLERSRRGLPVRRLPDDAWFMVAAAAVLTEPESAHFRGASERHDRIVEHMRALGMKMAAEQRWASLVPGLDGSFRCVGDTTSTSTRLEGLTALLQVLPKNDPDREVLDQSIRRGLGFILRAQVKNGDARGGFRGALGWRWPFRPALADEIRIDYVEHCLCAMVGYCLAESDRGSDVSVRRQP